MTSDHHSPKGATMRSRLLATLTIAVALVGHRVHANTPTQALRCPRQRTPAHRRRPCAERTQHRHRRRRRAPRTAPPVSPATGDAGNGRPLDGDTVFEIGSITKTFTTTLLALMVQDHAVDLDDPVASLLPAGTSVPSRDGRQITLEDLATHTSGLPRNPPNLAPKDPDNPYADYTVAQLYDFLAPTSSRRNPARTSSTPTRASPSSVTRSRSAPACPSKTSSARASSSRCT